MKKKQPTSEELNKETAKHLAHLDSEYSVYAAKNPRMSSERFYYLRDNISSITRNFLPSPSKGNLSSMLKAIAGFFTVSKQDEKEYWVEVWIRGGRRSLGDYNIKSQPSEIPA